MNTGVIFLGINWLGREAHQPFHLTLKEKVVEIYLQSPTRLHAVVVD
jgi:hypothetical protein